MAYIRSGFFEYGLAAEGVRLANSQMRSSRPGWKWQEWEPQGLPQKAAFSLAARAAAESHTFQNPPARTFPTGGVKGHTYTSPSWRILAVTAARQKAGALSAVGAA